MNYSKRRSIFDDNIIHEPGHIALLVIGCLFGTLVILMTLYLLVIRHQKKYINKYLEEIEIIWKMPIEIYLARLYKVSQSRNYRSEILDFKAIYKNLLTLTNTNVRKYNDKLTEKNFLSLFKLARMLSEIENLKRKWQKLLDDICYYLKQDATNLKALSSFQNIYQKLLKEMRKLTIGEIISKPSAENFHTHAEELFGNLYNYLNAARYDACEDILLNINNFMLLMVELMDVVPHIDFLITGWIPEQLSHFDRTHLPEELVTYDFEGRIVNVKSKLQTLQYKTAARITNELLEAIYKANQYLSEQEAVAKIYHANFTLLQRYFTQTVDSLAKAKGKLNKMDAKKFELLNLVSTDFKKIEANFLILQSKLRELASYQGNAKIKHLYNLQKIINSFFTWLQTFKAFLKKLDDFLVQSQNYLFKIEKYQTILQSCHKTVQGITEQSITIAFKTKIASYEKQLMNIAENIREEKNLVSETNRLTLEKIYTLIEELFLQIKQHLLLRELADQTIHYCIEYNASQTDKIASNNQRIIDRMYDNYKSFMYLDVLHDATLLLNKRKLTLDV